MSITDTTKDQVWKGKKGVLKRIRKEYETDPKENLIPYAVALYSFRQDRRCANELAGLFSQLIAEAERLIEDRRQGGEAISFANKMDVLSTHLEWIVRYKKLAEEERRKTLQFISRMCTEGLTALHPTHRNAREHNHRLLTLTNVRVLIAQGQRNLAWTFLRGEIDDIHEVIDVRQRARVFAKAGFLCRKLGRHVTGFRLGMNALTVPRVPLNVRAKSAVALAGVDR